MALPTYSKLDPKGWCGDPRRGAALGRPALHGAAQANLKFVLRKVRLCAGGYDCNGTYFGFGRPLYWYASVDGSVDAMLRADSREQAKAVIRERYPSARFFR